MEPKDRKRALETIGVMLAGFPSSQSSINEITPEAYLRAVSDCSLAAVEAACAAFLRGEVTGFNNDFPPTAPRLASLASALDQVAHSMANGPRFVSYPIGGKPPAGYAPLGPKEDRWNGPSRITKAEATKALPRPTSPAPESR
jgi:hypothetical protein